MKDNGVNRVDLPFSIAELGLLAAAMRSSMTHAAMYGRQGRASSDHYGVIRKRIEEIFPLPRHHTKEFAWFEGFTALETCKSYHLFWDKQALFEHEGRDDEGIQLALVVDGVRFSLTDRIPVSLKDKKAKIPVEWADVLQRCVDLADRAAHIDAEPATVLEVEMTFGDVERRFKSSLAEDQRAHLTAQIANDIGLKEADFYLAAIRTDYSARSLYTHKINVIGSHTRVEEIAASLNAEAGLGMKL